MKKYKLITCMLLFAGYLSAQNNLSALLPMPNQVKQIDSKKDFIISDKTTIQTNLPEEAFCIAELKNILQERTGKTPTLSSYGSSNSSIHLMLDPSIKGDEHYLIIRIRGNRYHKRSNTRCHPIRTYDFRSDPVRRCMPDFIGKDRASRNRRSTPFRLPFIDVRPGTSFPAVRRCEVLYRSDGTI